MHEEEKLDRLEELLQDFIKVTEFCEENSDPNSDLHVLRREAIEELL